LKGPSRVKEKAGQKRGPKPFYQDEILVTALQRIWYGVDLICAKRLKIAIPLWLPYYDQHYEPLSEAVKNKLLLISAASIDRVLKPIRDKLEIKKRCQTRPGTLLKHQIPFKKEVNWNPEAPGFVESDTVAHCGGTVTGSYAWSLTLTDIKTTWTENRAISASLRRTLCPPKGKK
jgi:hypothetical protein